MLKKNTSMSISSQVNEAEEEVQDDMTSYYIPRKFIFEAQDEKSNLYRTISQESMTSKNDKQTTANMPYVFNFPEPSDYKESYSKLIKHILNIYNQVRLLVVEV